ncbi:putative E3 ubiquitin-protein ligase XBAT34 [Brassica rapa]|uniref:putative E3 ubiquitin-protein ligase XBAT34 n=1 Tax=Brassica campestris TaxID=3711 RepID=UPI0004F1568D|nr:putative E3 ubiquitin-protein ligase XBAT34 [Brassica rapa]
MGQQQLKDEMLFQKVNHNDVESIKSHCHEGAGLEWADKDGRTPLILACAEAELCDVAETLKVARAKGYSDTVRAIESRICLFSGWMRELYGPSFLELCSPDQLLSRKVWVVIVPTDSRNPLKLELVVYASLQDAKPMKEIPLWKANLEELGSDQSDASVMIVCNSSRLKKQRKRGYISHARRWAQVDRQMRLKLAAATKGDIKHLNSFCEACKGTPQPMNPPMFMKTTEDIISNEVTPSVPLPRAVTVETEDGSVHYPSFSCAAYESKGSGGGSGVCVICEDASSEAACVPCGHVAGCVSCLKEIKNKKCPICRASIDQVIKLYHV